MKENKGWNPDILALLTFLVLGLTSIILYNFSGYLTNQLDRIRPTPGNLTFWITWLALYTILYFFYRGSFDRYPWPAPKPNGKIMFKGTAASLALFVVIGIPFYDFINSYGNDPRSHEAEGTLTESYGRRKFTGRAVTIELDAPDAQGHKSFKMFISNKQDRAFQKPLRVKVYYGIGNLGANFYAFDYKAILPTDMSRVVTDPESK